MGASTRCRRVGAEGDVAGDHLVEDHRGRVEIGPAVQRLGARLLGRHVLRRAADEALDRQHRRAIVRLAERRLGDPEVAHLDEVLLVPALDQHDVAGLEIAMDDPLGVRLFEGGEHLRQDSHHPRQRQGEVVADHLRQIPPGEQLHGDVEGPVAILPRIDDLDRVRVVQQRRALGFALEPADQLLVAHEVRVQHLDGHLLAERELLGLVDVAHRAAADEPVDPEVPRDDPPRQRVGPPWCGVLILLRAHGRRDDRAMIPQLPGL
jgi:hypothetical protein